MERNLQSSPQFECSVDTEDSTNLFRFSTILVANIEEVKDQISEIDLTILVNSIQEVKDRISEIERIFCRQLYPSFQSISGLVEKRLVEARKSAEDVWKKKESILLREIEQLRSEKKEAHIEIQRLNNLLEQRNRSLVDIEQLLNESEYEKKRLLDKLENLVNNEDIIAELKEQLRHKTIELAKEKEMLERQAQKMELKKKEFIEIYKNLKSEYNFLLKEKGCSLDNKPQLDMMEVEQASPVVFQNKRSLHDQDADLASFKRPEMNIRSNSQEKIEGDQANGMTKTSTADFRVNHSSLSSSHSTKHIAVDSKSKSSGSPKRAASSWRATRVRQKSKGVDPHDDFLNTPIELARNLYMGLPVEAQDFPVPASKDLNLNNSDDETQEINVSQPQQISNLQSVNHGFKYVEPVRKKSERENLKGVECKQCKKFYDAVLPDGGKGNTSNNNMRCEHHEGVSRHRYKYFPPLTPEGFWNIGFESEI